MASLAAYINTLTYAQGEHQGWFGKSPGHWRICSGIFCCFNAFSRVDMRVEVTIPGTVESYVVDSRGERHEATTELWQETYLSAIVRSLLYSDDSNYALRGFRKFDPLPNLDAERRFLETCETLFWKGPQLGTDSEIQIATLVRNHLTNALSRYFSQSLRYDVAVEFYEKIVKHHMEATALLADAYIGMDEEVKAVRALYDAVKHHPNSYALIHVQVDFLRSKGKLELARDLAKHAVNSAPSEFVTWAKLAQVYIDLEDYNNALLTLNSCPMFTFNERDVPRAPPPLRAHYLQKSDPQALDSSDDYDREFEAGTLPRLPGSLLKGTFARAYFLLSKITSLIGWDELLKCRSSVFVMEEEYRQLKAREEDEKRNEDVETNKELKKDHKARSNSLIARPEAAGGLSSSESDEDKAEPAEEEAEEKKKKADKPPVPPFGMAFSNKRLCERWLDNMFMVLYEDLRAYTIWRADVAHHRKQNLSYYRVAADWESLGDLAYRLVHHPEAKDAYEHVVESGKFSGHVTERLLDMYAEADNLAKALEMMVALAKFHDKHFNDVIYPINITYRLNKMIADHGYSKVNNTLISDPSTPVTSQKLVQRYMNYSKVFGVEGWNA